MTLTNIELSLIKNQIHNDTYWCFPCGIYNRTHEAKGVSYINNTKIYVCKECFEQQLIDGIKIDYYIPVIQPSYISLLNQLMNK